MRNRKAGQSVSNQDQIYLSTFNGNGTKSFQDPLQIEFGADVGLKRDDGQYYYARYSKKTKCGDDWGMQFYCPNDNTNFITVLLSEVYHKVTVFPKDTRRLKHLLETALCRIVNRCYLKETFEQCTRIYKTLPGGKDHQMARILNRMVRMWISHIPRDGKESPDITIENILFTAFTAASSDADQEQRAAFQAALQEQEVTYQKQLTDHQEQLAALQTQLAAVYQEQKMAFQTHTEDTTSMKLVAVMACASVVAVPVSPAIAYAGMAATGFAVCLTFFKKGI